MYVRDARNRDEVWLLDCIEDLELDEAAFRSRDYVIAVDEETNERAGFGRIRIHTEGDTEYCELTSVGILDGWRGQGVGAHVIERLVENTGDEEFDELYALVDTPEFFEQFGFERIDEDDLPGRLAERLKEKRSSVAPAAVPMYLSLDRFMMPADLREAFKRASTDEDAETESEETAEDFGIDPETATYKYDTGS